MIDDKIELLMNIHSVPTSTNHIDWQNYFDQLTQTIKVLEAEFNEAQVTHVVTGDFVSKENHQKMMNEKLSLFYILITTLNSYRSILTQFEQMYVTNIAIQERLRDLSRSKKVH
jgi:hypothetical protein